MICMVWMVAVPCNVYYLFFDKWIPVSLKNGKCCKVMSNVEIQVHSATPFVTSAEVSRCSIFEFLLSQLKCLGVCSVFEFFWRDPN